MTTLRKVQKVLDAMATSDGAGVRLKRSIGTPHLDHLDPFLLLDQFDTENPDDYIAGFPDHPHRGFETVTYMIDGRMRHADNTGEGGVLGPGGVQWMTAGRGIVHSEMPEQQDGAMKGFQLWVNLPAKDKMTPPRYQNIEPADVPEIVRDNGAKLRIVAGAVDGVSGAVSGVATDPVYLDIRLPAGVGETVPVPKGHNAFVFCFEGSVEIDNGLGGRDIVRNGQLGILADGDALAVTGGAEGGRVIFAAARPLREPVARYGPFVMNTREEIVQAFKDYEAGRF